MGSFNMCIEIRIYFVWYFGRSTVVVYYTVFGLTQRLQVKILSYRAHLVNLGGNFGDLRFFRNQSRAQRQTSLLQVSCSLGQKLYTCL